MSRTFLYARVSTFEQHTGNQIEEVKAAGFTVEPKRVIEEQISGSTVASERPGFAKLLERLEDGDILIVTKLDRLGRNALDVRMTVERLTTMGVKVHCLAFGGIDLTSAAGKMTMGVIATVAEFERDLLIERTHAGLARAKAAGKIAGRKPTLNAAQQREARERLDSGETITTVAKAFGTTRQTIMRIREKTDQTGAV
jgi:putative DNA-invertase from lambdoid prophage Rac